MAGVTDAKQTARRLLDVEESRAWRDYLLDATRDLAEFRYEEIEPWAWARLQRALVQIGGRRARLE